MVASAVPAHAAGDWDAFIDAVDLSGISAKVIAAGLLIIGVAIAFKGPTLAKRIVRQFRNQGLPMISGALVALFFALMGMLGGLGAVCFVLGFRSNP